MAKIIFDNKFNIMLDSGMMMSDIEGRFTKVKGYSGFTFFSHKMDKVWYVREFYTGRDIGHGETERDAKIAGKAHIMEHTEGDKKKLQAHIESISPINRMEDYD